MLLSEVHYLINRRYPCACISVVLSCLLGRWETCGKVDWKSKVFNRRFQYYA